MSERETWMTWERWCHAIKVRCRVDLDEWMVLREAWESHERAMREAGRRAGLGQAANVCDRESDHFEALAKTENRMLNEERSLALLQVADAIRALAAPAPAPDSKEGM
jgi:hypothetical protein